MSRTSRAILLAIPFLALLGTSVPVARAGTLGIDIGRVGADPIHLTPDLVEIAPGVFGSSDSLTVEGQFELSWQLRLEGDPNITGSFTLQNLSGTTQTFSVTATLGVLPLAGPTRIGGSYGDVVFTDFNNDGVVFFDASPFYNAQIDGASVQSLGNLHGGPTSGTFPIESFGVPIPSAPGPGVATSIGVAFPAFSLTAGDRLETPFGFTVEPVPEPASIVLVALGLAALRCRPCKRSANDTP
jgi:PEP-CTERM motif